MKENNLLDSRIKGSYHRRYLLELFQNSGSFAMVNILLESLLEGINQFIKEPDLYIIVSAVLIQTYFLTKWQYTQKPRKFLGNLIAPFLYSLIEIYLEGWLFLDAIHHLAYWVFSLSIGSIQAIRFRFSNSIVNSSLIILENIVRSAMVFAMYVILELHLEEWHRDWLKEFFYQIPHQYFLLATLLLGTGVGIAELIAEKYLTLLKSTSLELRTYSKWFLGENLLNQAIFDKKVLALERKNRTVFFMDIRGFTSWSERELPEDVVNVLNQYFIIAEKALTYHDAIKIKFTGDEVMAVFKNTDDAVISALEIRLKLEKLLSQYKLGAGIGIHKGLLMEGIIGAEQVKYYDVIGDTVNTAKRIEGEANSGEILISDSCLDSLDLSFFEIGEQKEVSVKGKQVSLTLYPIYPIVNS